MLRLAFAFVYDEFAFEVGEELWALLLLIQLDDLDVVEFVLQCEGEREPAGVVGVAALPKVELALDRVLALFFRVLRLVVVAAFAVALICRRRRLVYFPIFTNKQVAVLRIELSKFCLIYK